MKQSSFDTLNILAQLLCSGCLDIEKVAGHSLGSIISIPEWKTNIILAHPRTTPSGRKVIRRRKKDRRKKEDAARLQRRTGSARTSLGPI